MNASYCAPDVDDFPPLVVMVPGVGAVGCARLYWEPVHDCDGDDIAAFARQYQTIKIPGGA